jgi:hypothetical protein
MYSYLIAYVVWTVLAILTLLVDNMLFHIQNEEAISIITRKMIAAICLGNSCERNEFLYKYGGGPPFACNTACIFLGISLHTFE